MIVSHSRKFIFIKTRKVGGTSVEIALSEHCAPDDIIGPIKSADERIRVEAGFLGSQNVFDENGKQIVHPHDPASRIRELVGKRIWDDYFKFTVERNPWDKVVSAYYWKYKSGQPAVPFKDWVLSGGGYNVSDFDLYCIEGVLQADFVVRYEELEQGLSKVYGHIGIDRSPDLARFSAKAGIRPQRDLSTYYDDETREAVAVRFAREIRLFGWEYPGT